jgi:anaerobic magnesium-protoporphyrin IX monomethyl ester cyclase
MRVLLVQSKSVSSGDNPILPLGLCYLATALADNHHDINIYDTNTSTNPVTELKRLIHKSEPDMIGVSLRNIDTNFNSAVPTDYVQPFSELVSSIKEIAPKTKILAGGPGFSIFGQRLMERLPGIDYGIFNEGEETVPELLDNIDRPQSVKGIFFRNNGTILFTGAREPIDFARFPAPRRNFLDLGPYLERPHSIGVQTKRGCYFNCVYCVYPYLQGTTIRMRPPKAVLDELEEMVRKYNLRSFFFVDSIFNVPQSHAREIMEGMLARGLELKWRGFDEAKYFDTDYCKLAKTAGCNHFDFSPDGISKSTLTALNKVTSAEDIKRAYSICKNIDDVKVTFNFFMNGPGESLDNIIRLVIFMIRCRLVLRKKISDIQLLFVRIYPNTPIFDLAVEKGITKPSDDIIKTTLYNPPPWRYIIKSTIFVYKAVRSCYRVFKRKSR